jgi:uncharacterized glyoxalase superfamily protein PhnB
LCVQRIFPYLQYADAPGAIAFLAKAFGFVERMRYPMPDGSIGHCEMELEGGVIYLASVWRQAGFAAASELPGVHSQLMVRVSDVDAHHTRAREAGATIAEEPTVDHGQRRYRALDLEAQRWVFFADLGGGK